MYTIKNLRWFNILILLAMVLAPLSSTASTKASTPEIASDLEFVPDRLLARLQDGFTLDGDHLQSLGVQSAQPLFRGQSLPPSLANILRLEFIPGSDVKAMMESLSQDPRFDWIEPDYLAVAAQTENINVTPNDPLYPNQWGLTKIEAPAAWDVQTGSETVVIAIVDSGIQRTHSDLQARMWVNPGEVAGNGVDDDNNGLIDDVHGWDFVSEDNDPLDDNGHGTQVAGVAVATTNNSTGIAGTCWNCRLMAVKVMSAGGVANYSDIAQGVLYAAQKGAKVINLSLGGYSYSNALLETIQTAVNDYGAIVVAGAGNDNTNAPFYPAAYEAAIAVAGTDQSDLKASFSDYGSWVDLSAPAVAIHTTFSGGDYGPVDGTSMAAPFVSGVAGLLFSEHPDWSGALVRAQMTHTAGPIDALNPGYEGLLGSGRINAANALTVAAHPLFAILEKIVNGDPLGRPNPGESATLEITLANDWLDAQAVQGTLSTSDPYVTITQDTSDFGDLPAGGSGSGVPAYTFDVAAGAGYDHPINFALELSAIGGYQTTLDFSLKTRSAEQQVWGTIGEDTSWTNDKTYIVVGNVGVAPGITLTIEAGTDVLFNGNYSLNVGGQLIAGGTEDQPIRFLSNTGEPWGRIYFDDTSIDATTDLDGNYLGGNILRWVLVAGAGQGIGCNNATPYLSHLTTDGGGMSCALGTTSLWLMESELSGEMNISGDMPVRWWVDRSPMLAERMGLAAVVVNGRIFAIGGRDEANGPHSSMEEYNPSTDTWIPRASMSTQRAYVAAAVMNGKIYVFGGENDSGYLSSVEEYDPATDLWTPRADMSIARAQHVVLAGANGKIYAIGGRNSSVHLSLVEEYDPQTDSWAVRADMPTPRRASGAAEVNGIIYVIGGMSYDSPTSAVEAYDPSTDTWTSRTDMPIAQEGITATSLDNHIYVIGGVYELTTVEVYNPELNSWTAGHDINNGRHNPAAVSMGEKIYVIGGVHSYSCGYACVEENHTPNILNTRIQNLTLINGGITVPGYSQIVSSQISGGITAGSGSVVSETTLGGSIQYEGYGISQNNFAKGSITIGSGEVLSNTLQGGIIAGDGSIIQGNNVENSSPWGWSIQTSGNVTIQGNRLAGSAAGIYASDGTIQGNLVANSAGVGLYIMGDANVISNTFTANLSNTIVIQSGAPTIQGNNLEGNSGTFDIQNLTANDIQAQGNWWGTTEESMISQRIYDYNDDYTLGYVVYPPVADGPIQDAPAYVRSVTVDPNPAGIETATFEVEFSKPMDVETIPQLSFQSPLNNTWTVFNTSNSELPADNVYSSASDADGSVWFGTEGGGVAKFDGTTWTVYNTTNSGLPNDTVSSILVDPDGSYWFGTGYGVAHFDGTTWTVYNTTNSGLPTDSVTSIANDPDGSHWFGTQGGVAHFDGTTWTVHNTVNSGLPNDSITSIATDPNGSHWFGTHGGVAHFDDTTWTAYDLYNSGLPDNYVTTILSDPDGSHWFGTMGMGLAHFDGTTWTVYTTSNSGIPSDAVVSITIDTDGSYWFGSYGNGVAHFDGTNWTVYSTTNSELPENYVMTIDTDTDGSHWFGTLNGGVGVLWNYPPYVVQDNPQWLDDSHFRASFDITSLIPRGDYRITVADALGTDSIQIAPNSAFTFTVDYAGGVGDTTAPGLPSVTACAGATLDSLSASWSASDPDSEITLYQYAIGTSPGATDVINWTFTDQTSVDLDGLTLTPGQLYYISVKARNAGGLWSEAATPDGMLPGSGVCTTSGFMAYLSLVSK